MTDKERKSLPIVTFLFVLFNETQCSPVAVSLHYSQISFNKLTQTRLTIISLLGFCFTYPVQKDREIIIKK